MDVGEVASETPIRTGSLLENDDVTKTSSIYRDNMITD